MEPLINLVLKRFPGWRWDHVGSFIVKCMARFSAFIQLIGSNMKYPIGIIRKSLSLFYIQIDCIHRIGRGIFIYLRIWINRNLFVERGMHRHMNHLCCIYIYASSIMKKKLCSLHLINLWLDFLNIAFHLTTVKKYIYAVIGWYFRLRTPQESIILLIGFFQS